MSVAAQTLSPPSRTLMFLEGRAISELGAFLGALPLLSLAPKGDGHPVLALPGFLASDLSMAPMRRYLKELGYDTHAWNMGRNLGGVASKRVALRDLLQRIHDQTGRKVSLIGWSLGGVYARDLALQMPDMLPVIGKAPRHPGLWFDFGHQHHGLTLGPATGRLLAEMMTGETPFADPRPYAAERFS